MEPKARFVLVGVFVSIFSMVGIAIVLWIVGAGSSQKKYDVYVVKTDKSVGGLNKDADVRYKGVKVGKVISIKIDKNNPQYIEIYIEVEKDLPVKTDTKAKISSNGLTGIAYINLIGGSKNKPLLKATSGREYPIIKTVPTTLEKLSVLAGSVMKNTNKFLKKLNTVFNKRTINYIHSTVKNIKDISENIKRLAKGLQKSEKKLDDLLSNTNALALKLQNNSKNVDKLIDNVNRLTKDTDALIQENSKNIKLFTKNGFENINAAFTNLRKTSNQLRELLIQIKQNPSVLIRGKTLQKGPGE